MNNKERCLQLHVNSVANNPANIMSGEPYYLGFDFFIKKDDIKEMINFVSLVLKELDVPLINMTILGEKDLNNDDILTKKEIVKEIKKYAVAYRVQARKCYDLKHEKN